MKFKLIVIFICSIAFLSSQEYCVGEQISIADQNATHSVCAGFENYETGSEFKLADYNGELNGGNYNIIVIDMSASW